MVLYHSRRIYPIDRKGYLMSNAATEEWGNIELPGLSDEVLYKKKWNQVAALKGRKRPDQSEFMTAHNPMAGKEHPNKGKAMPKTSAKLLGKSKTKEHAENISKAKKGVPVPKLQGRKRPDQSALMKDPSRNKGAKAMSELHTCPHCGKTANLPNYTRWHGENCKMKLA